MQIFLLLLLCYILYRFVVGFVLPVVRTTRSMKRQFEQMKQQAPFQQTSSAETSGHHSTFSQSTSDQNHHTRTTSGRKGAKEDYIDFEELPSK